MEYKGKVYAKINGKYIECTQTVEDLEAKIKELESGLLEVISILHNIGFEGDISHIIQLIKKS